MHRVDSEDYSEETPGIRLYKESPLPRTIVGYNLLNALQEEVADVIISTGTPLRASGAADKAAGYKGQLRAAIEKKITDVEDVLQPQISENSGLISNLSPNVNELMLEYENKINGLEWFSNDTANPWKSGHIRSGYAGMRINSLSGGYIASLGGGYTKTFINSAGDDYETFVSGSGNGAVASGADPISHLSWLHVFIVASPSVAVEIIADTDINGSNAKVGYQTAHSVGSLDEIGLHRIFSLHLLDVLNNRIYEIKQFCQVGNQFTWKTPYSSFLYNVSGLTLTEINLDTKSLVDRALGQVSPATANVIIDELQILLKINSATSGNYTSVEIGGFKSNAFLCGGRKFSFGDGVNNNYIEVNLGVGYDKNSITAKNYLDYETCSFNTMVISYTDTRTD